MTGNSIGDDMRYGVDWSQNPDKLVIITDDENGGMKRVQWRGDFFSWIKTLQRGDIALLECPFEPFHHHIRNSIIDYCESNGIILLTINPRETSNEAINRGLQPKSKDDSRDLEDAKILFGFLVDGKKHLLKPRKVEVKPLTWDQECNMDRRNGWLESMKLYDYLIPECPPEHLEALTNNGEYADGFVLPMVRAAVEVTLEGDGRRDTYDKYVGGYSGAQPSFLRATFYRRVRTLDQRVIGTRSFKKQGIRIIVDHYDTHKKNMRAVRRATRWLFSQVKVQRAPITPEMGTPNPA